MKNYYSKDSKSIFMLKSTLKGSQQSYKINSRRL